MSMGKLLVQNSVIWFYDICLPRWNDTVRMRSSMDNLRHLNGPFLPVLSGAELRHSLIRLQYIRVYTLKIQHRLRHRISAPDITGKYGAFIVPYKANYGENTHDRIDRPGYRTIFGFQAKSLVTVKIVKRLATNFFVRLFAWSWVSKTMQLYTKYVNMRNVYQSLFPFWIYN
jgi:hypothetical protein